MRKRILIADDEKDIMSILSLFLSQKGYEVITAFDGIEALEKTNVAMPDLILLDIMMPKLDGISVNRELKNNLRTKKIPVIFITGKNNLFENKQLLESGEIYGYFEKPFLLKELLPKLEEALNMVK